MSLTATQRAAMRHREANDCSLVMLPNPSFWNNKNKTDEEKQEIKDRAQTLQAGIRLSYDEKVAHAEKVIRMALDLDIQGQPMVPPGPTAGVKWALSYSGGKDSTVLSHLMVFGMGLKLPHVMSNTRMEYPETLKQVTKWYAMLREWGVECHTAYPDAKPKDLWKKIGALYNSVSHRQWIANPLAFWTQEDVERYLDDNDIRPIRIPTVRGGSGCVTCMFGCHLVEKGKPNALQELAVLNPKMHAAALDDWGYRPVLDLLGIPYEKIPENFPRQPPQPYNTTHNVMPLETELAELTKAIKANTEAILAAFDHLERGQLAVGANTEALLAVLAASGNTNALEPAAAPAAAPAPAPAKKQAKATPAPAPVATPAPAAEEITEETAPTKVAAPAPVADDTPGVAPTLPDSDYPDAIEHVDVDEVYSEITKIVKAKIGSAGDNAGVIKQKWFDSIASFGVEKAADLKTQPAKLQAALKLAKAL